jgi:tetratricopeptide (TPR) repeat protein
MIYEALFCEEQGRKLHATELITRAVAVLGELERDDDYALAVNLFAWISIGIGDQQEIVSRAEEGIALYRAKGAGCWLIRALTASFRVYVRVVGDLSKAESYLRESIELQKSLGEGTVFFADSLGALGLIRCWQGHRAEGCRLILESLALAESYDDAWGILWTLQFAARAHRDQGDYPAAEAFARRCISHARELGNFETLPWCHLTLGSVLIAQHCFEEAAFHYNEGVAQGGGDLAILARAQLGLGQIALQRGEYREAARCLAQSLHFYEEKGISGGVASVLEALGHLACAEQRYDLARGHFGRALELARRRQRPAALIGVVAGVARLSAREGRTLRAAELAGLAKHHAATTHATSAQWIDPLIAELKITLGEAELCALIERGRHLNLEAVADEMLR